MFELRLQDAGASIAGSVDGLCLGSFVSFGAALNALDGEHGRLIAQLVANGEGATELRLRTAVVEVEQGAETGWLWSSYQPSTGRGGQ